MSNLLRVTRNYYVSKGIDYQTVKEQAERRKNDNRWPESSMIHTHEHGPCKPGDNCETIEVKNNDTITD